MYEKIYGLYDKILTPHFSARYEVAITTSKIAKASSNSAFWYTFIGTKGKTGELRANNIGDDRQKGQRDVWKFTDDVEIGEFRCIHMRMFGGDAWHFTHVLNF